MDALIAQRPFTVSEFQRLADAGILAADERVELLDGKVVEMPPIGSRHAACVRQLTRLLTRSVGSDLLVDVQNPVHVDRRSQLVPDLMLLHARSDLYAERHPRPRDVLLLIEVADATLDYDREVKIPRYGAAGVAEAWLVDLRNRRVIRFHDPAPKVGYETIETFVAGQAIRATTMSGLSLRVDDVFGPEAS